MNTPVDLNMFLGKGQKHEGAFLFCPFAKSTYKSNWICIFSFWQKGKSTQKDFLYPIVDP